MIVSFDTIQNNESVKAAHATRIMAEKTVEMAKLALALAKALEEKLIQETYDNFFKHLDSFPPLPSSPR
jgi:hypothetical protein